MQKRPFQTFLKAALLPAFLPALLVSQGTLEDYKRASYILTRNRNQLVFKTKVRPRWIKDSARFWYRIDTQKGKKFVTVDPGKGTWKERNKER